MALEYKGKRLALNVDIRKIVSGGGYDIYYGDTAPTDTSKLWIKGTEPTSLEITGTEPVKNKDAIDEYETVPQKSGSNNACCASVGKYIYVFGGNYVLYNDTNKLRIIKKINTETNEVTQWSDDNLSPYRGIQNASAVAVGKYIYIFGGKDTYYGSTLDTILKFDTETETLTKLNTTLPKRISGIFAVLIGKYVYISGGIVGALDDVKVYIFDTETETISDWGVNVPIGAYASAVAVGKYIYVFGGQYATEIPDKIYKVDTETKNVQELSTKLPYSLVFSQAQLVDKYIYIFGGATDVYNASALDTILKFDTETETIEILSTTLPEPRYGFCSAKVNSDIFLLYGRGEKKIFSSFLKFYKGIELTNNKALVYMALKTTLNQFYINVNKVYRGDENNTAQTQEAYIYNGSEWVLVGTYGVYEDTNGDVVLAGDIIATDDNNGNVVIS